MILEVMVTNMVTIVVIVFITVLIVIFIIPLATFVCRYQEWP